MNARTQQAPAFRRLKDQLLRVAADRAPGAKFPSVRELRRQFSLSQATVDKALFELETEGYIQREQGRGTFVRERAASAAVKNELIALVVPFLNVSSFFMDIAHGVEDELFQRGYQMLLCASRLDAARGGIHIERFMADDNTRGVIYASSNAGTELVAGLNALAAEKPLAILDVAVPGVVADYVTTDDKSGAFEAVEHLIKSGHRKIAFLTAERSDATSTLANRFDGYRAALKANGVSFDYTLVIKAVDCEIGYGRNAVREALAEGLDITALFCASDDLAVGALEALFERGVDVPAEMSVVGFGELDFNNPYKLRLTTVAQPAEEMGRRAVALIDERIRGKRPMNNVKEIVLPARLCVKET